jgi:hypothetical protein
MPWCAALSCNILHLQPLDDRGGKTKQGLTVHEWPGLMPRQ